METTKNKINVKLALDYYYRLDAGTVILITGIVLHSGGEINRDRLLALLRKADANSQMFVRPTPETNMGVRNLYHWKSKNLNKFFADENLLYVYREVLADAKTLKNYEFTIEQLIEYVRLMVNKPRNFCIDWLYSNIFSRLLETDCYSFNGLNLPIKVQKIDDFEVSGYCCDDCDGDFEQYKAYRYENQVIKRASEDLKDYFISIKRYKVVDPKVMEKINQKNRNLYR